MFKAMILLKRREDATHEEFAQWWLQGHRPLAEQLPGLKRAVFNLAQKDPASDYDGVSELWFESKADFDAAYASDIGKAVARDSLDNVASRTRLFVDEHIIKS
ncbi:EthD family reductase [Kiloniella laminariae]|uniref:EthD family reductase n=1 Tax=Kiloniella laminariae TaxID=454162 RepID=A0ABT4LK58_9PROT|nr:EthD family reductase [Kiloniella laminariae]MCZ4281340.1 EthD family reductase [Kiloniella laminariae]